MTNMQSLDQILDLFTNVVGAHRIPDAVPDAVTRAWLKEAAETQDPDRGKALVVAVSNVIRAQMDALPDDKSRLHFENTNPFGLSRPNIRKVLSWGESILRDAFPPSGRSTDQDGHRMIVVPSMARGTFLMYHGREEDKPPCALLMDKTSGHIIDVIEVPANRFESLWQRSVPVNLPDTDDVGDTHEAGTEHLFQMVPGASTLPEEVPDDVLCEWAQHPRSWTHKFLLGNALWWRRVIGRPIPALGVDTAILEADARNLSEKVGHASHRASDERARVIWRYLPTGGVVVFMWESSEPAPMRVCDDNDGLPTHPDEVEAILDRVQPLTPAHFEAVWAVSEVVSSKVLADMKAKAAPTTLVHKTSPAIA